MCRTVAAATAARHSSGKLEGRGGQHFSLLEILSSSRRTQWAQNIFEFIFLTLSGFTRYFFIDST